MKVVCGARTFPTKKAFEQYVRTLIYERIGACRSVSKKSLALFAELRTVLLRHPTVKRNADRLDDIAVKKTKLNKNALQTVVFLRTDSAKRRKGLTISWRNAIDKKVPSATQGLESAMRSAVARQIKHFRNGVAVKVCELCGATDALEVDHVHEFAKLKVEFLKTTKHEVPTNFSYKRRTFRRRFLKEDKTFQYAWARFHKTRASLRLLCKPCNLARNKKEKTTEKAKTTEKVKTTENARLPAKERVQLVQIPPKLLVPAKAGLEIFCQLCKK